MVLGKKDEEKEIAKASFSAVGPILLGFWLKQKQAQKVRAAMSFM